MPKVTVNPILAEVEMVTYKGYSLPKSIADKCDDMGHFIRCAQLYANAQQQLARASDSTQPVEVSISANRYRMVNGRVRKVS